MPKPRHKKRKFIDPTSCDATTFSLVHRSQQDPLVTDEAAPQRVLVQQNKDKDKREEELAKFGVFFDDEYDYMQHLRTKEDLFKKDFSEMDQFLSITTNGTSSSQSEKPGNDKEAPEASLRLPSSVFASDFEEPVGLLNRNAPKKGPLLDWDPDIVETLDDDFKHERVFTLQDEEKSKERDDFDEFLDQAFGSDNDDGEEDSDSNFGNGSVDSGEFNDVETASKFTEYSMSSSVVPRSENLRMLDDKFDKFYEAYLEENIGGLDLEEIEGFKSSSTEVLKSVLEEYKHQRSSERQKLDFNMTSIPEEYHYVSDCNEEEEEEEEADDKHPIFNQQELKEEKWDCESILSTYSNIYNHPKLIKEPSLENKKDDSIKISGKTGMPKDVFGKGLTAIALKQLNQLAGEGDYETNQTDYDNETLASRASQLSIRPKHETTEEKRERKLAFKEFRRERRIEKKVNKLAFRDEELRQKNATAINKGAALKRVV